MKIMDKNGRLFGKISIIDVVVILVIAVMAVALHTKSDLREIAGTGAESTPIVYQIRCWSAPNYQADSLKVGDMLYDSDSTGEGSLGKIVKIERSEGNGTRMTALPSGEMKNVPVEDTSDLLITVEGSGLVTDDGHYKLNHTYELGVNCSRMYCTRYTQIYGVVDNIID